MGGLPVCWLTAGADSSSRCRRAPVTSNSRPVEVIPALDLRGGRVVRLRQGDFDREQAYAADPTTAAAAYAAAGARRLHVVDLDAARGGADNEAAVAAILAAVTIEVQVAGGVRDRAGADRWLAAGAAAVVMGTTAVRAPEVLLEVASAYPARVL